MSSRGNLRSCIFSRLNQQATGDLTTALLDADRVCCKATACMSLLSRISYLLLAEQPTCLILITRCPRQQQRRCNRRVQHEACNECMHTQLAGVLRNPPGIEGAVESLNSWEGGQTNRSIVPAQGKRGSSTGTTKHEHSMTAGAVIAGAAHPTEDTSHRVVTSVKLVTYTAAVKVMQWRGEPCSVARCQVKGTHNSRAMLSGRRYSRPTAKTAGDAQARQLE
jgi:hypothetical protein